jgi:Ca2+-binding RTX toxin-like protein
MDKGETMSGTLSRHPTAVVTAITMALIAAVAVVLFLPSKSANAASPGLNVVSAKVIKCKGIPATIWGNANSNKITGTPHRDVIQGRGGHDDIEGRKGKDIICGGWGADDVEGNRRNDRLFGGPGADDLEGNRGPDQLYGGRGFDRADGGQGNDFCLAEKKDSC